MPAGAKLLKEAVGAWAREAGRRARDARKVGRALATRRRAICARVLLLLSLHAADEQAARRRQLLEGGLAQMSRRRWRRASKRGFEVWREWGRHEAAERRLHIEREQRRAKMQTFLEAAARRAHVASDAAAGELSGKAGDSSDQPEAAPAGGLPASPGAADWGGAAVSDHECLSEGSQPSGAACVLQSGADRGGKPQHAGAPAFHKSCEAIAERHAQR